MNSVKRCINCKYYEADKTCKISQGFIKYPYANTCCKYYLNYFKEVNSNGKS